jgi:hypothetical protein
VVNCNRARRLIFREIDAALTADESQRLREHLADCPPCRRWREEARAQSALLSWALTMEAPSGDVETAVLRRIQAAQVSSRSDEPRGCQRYEGEEGEPLTEFLRNFWLASRRRWAWWVAWGAVCGVALWVFFTNVDAPSEETPIPSALPPMPYTTGVLYLSADEIRQSVERFSRNAKMDEGNNPRRLPFLYRFRGEGQ